MAARKRHEPETQPLQLLAQDAIRAVKVSGHAPSASVIPESDWKRLRTTVKNSHATDTQLSLDFVYASAQLQQLGFRAAAEQVLALARLGLSEKAVAAAMDSALPPSSARDGTQRSPVAKPALGGVGLRRQSSRPSSLKGPPRKR